MAKLIIERYRHRPTLFPLYFKETLIGRIDSCHLVLDDSTVSRVHARILRNGESYHIEDLQSMSGVFVNGAKLQRTEALGDGDVIELGRSKMVFRQSDEA